MLSGYKTLFCGNTFNVSICNISAHERIKEFKQLYSCQPLSLKRLAANIIRVELYPNAVVGSSVLSQTQPGEKSAIIPRELASFITFGLTQENIDQVMEEEWTP